MCPTSGRIPPEQFRRTRPPTAAEVAEAQRVMEALMSNEPDYKFTRVIKSDEHSHHGLPVGAIVHPYYVDGTLRWTQGGDGDEVSIDERDLEPSTTFHASVEEAATGVIIHIEDENTSVMLDSEERHPDTFDLSYEQAIAIHGDLGAILARYQTRQLNEQAAEHLVRICDKAGLAGMKDVIQIVIDRHSTSPQELLTLNAGDITTMYDELIAPAIDKLESRLQVVAAGNKAGAR